MFMGLPNMGSPVGAGNLGSFATFWDIPCLSLLH